MRKRLFLRQSVALLLALAFLFSVLPPIRAAEHKYLALTFDDGPSGKYTRRLLSGLQERNVKATFFLCGYRMETYQGLTREIVQAGHEIGLHGYSHDSMGKMSPAALRRELDDTQNLLSSITPYPVTLLRPPGGQSTGNVEKLREDRGLSLIFWSVDPKDWATQDPGQVSRQVIASARDGDIILLHDMSDSSVTAAFTIIDTLSKEGFSFVTVSQMAALRGESLCAGALYYSLPGPIRAVG